MEYKSYLRSIRMTETVRGYVEKHPGNGFNEKFENLVLYFMAREQEHESRISFLFDEINRLNDLISEKRVLLQQLERISSIVESVLAYSESLNIDD